MAADVANIVFTKNRPLQLEGYLRSLYRQYKPELFQTYIIYKEELFGEQYDDVFKCYPNITVIREKSFYGDFFGLIADVQSKYMLFGIDDVAFFDGVDYALIDKTFEAAGDSIFGFTLRFARKGLEKEGEEVSDIKIGEEVIYNFDWTKGKTVHSRYPFELCCTFYRTSLVKEILRNVVCQNRIAESLFSPDSGLSIILPLRFRRKVFKRFGFIFSPNTLESWPCRWCQRNTDKLPKLTYFQKLCASAIQVNMVNTSTGNTFDSGEEYTVESLNEKFCDGYRFNLEHLINNRPPSLSCGKEYFRLAKIK